MTVPGPTIIIAIKPIIIVRPILATWQALSFSQPLSLSCETGIITVAVDYQPSRVVVVGGDGGF